jgi:hypothetical protein
VAARSLSDTQATCAATAPQQGEPFLAALEVDRAVPPSGNLQIGSQQVWLGPALAGRKVTLWIDEASLHVLLDGTRLKTLPSRLGITELARLAADGARPAGPSPLPSGPGTAIEVERMVNGHVLASLAGSQVNVGYELAGQQVTLRMDGTQMAVLSHDGTLQRTVPARSPVPSGHACAAPGAPQSARRGPPGHWWCSGGSRSAARSWLPRRESTSG